MKVACCSALLALLVSPAMAMITVTAVPDLGSINFGTMTLEVDVLADIPTADATVGWGIDLDFTDPAYSFAAADVVIGPDWVPAFAFDEDGLAGLVQAANPPITGNTLLATVTVHFTSLVLADACPSDSNPFPHDPNLGADLTEGFALDTPIGGFADVTYVCGTIPEPATLSLLALGGLALLRRR
jgi:hypothetical protein